jgi:D-galactarolactone cycloisomerase
MAVSSSSSSRIVRIDGYEVSCPLPERIGNSRGFFDSRGALLVALTTADGVTGWGETWALPGAAAAVIRHELGPLLLGRDCAAPRRLHDLMMRQLPERHGVPLMAVSALDIAVWDAAARTAGRPLHAVLGGAVRERVFAYVSGPFLKPGSDPFKDYFADLDGYLEAGFRAIKLRLGTAPTRDGDIARRVRERIGPGMPLMVDLNQGFSFGLAVDLAQRLTELDVRWLEEPMPHDDLAGYRRLAEQVPIALAGGESLFGLGAFREVIGGNLLQFVQPDLALCGGLTEGLKIAALAEAFGIPLVPHVWGTAVNFNASLHFTAVLPEKAGQGMPCPLFEYDYSFNPLRTMCGAAPLDGAGALAVPDGPGLGLSLSPENFASFIVNQWTVQ